MAALTIVALAAATLAAFWPGLDGEFLNWDDDRNFVENLSYRGLGLDQLRWAWQTYHLGVWQPCSWLLLGLQYEIGEMDPAVYRCANLVLHVINVVVFYWLTVVMLRVASPQIGGTSSGIHLCAASAAMLFAVHPLRVEAVAWVSCQPYLPAALFYMLAVVAYIGGAARPPASARTGHSGTRRTRKEKNTDSELMQCIRGLLPRWGWLAVVFVCYLVAVASKAVAVSLPVVLLILDVYPLRRWGGRAGWLSRAGLHVLTEKLPFLAVAVVISIWAAAAKDYSESRVPFSTFDADARLAQSAYGLVFYLGKTVAPVDLIPYYRLPDDLSLFTWRYGLPAVAVLAVTVGLIGMRHRWPAALAAWAAYVVILLPNLGVVQIAQQIATDRYSYVAIMPVMLLLGGALFKLWRHQWSSRIVVRSTLLAGVVAATAGLTLSSRQQVLVWRDSITLWEATLAVDPRCAVAECQLGHALVVAGQSGEAVSHFEAAMKLKPGFSFASSNLGAILYSQGRFARAVECFGRALAIEPCLGKLDRAKTHAGLGAAYAGLGQYDLAWKHTRQAQRLGLKAAQKMIDYLGTVSEEPKEPVP